MRLDRDFEKSRVVGAGEVGEGLAALGAALLVGRQGADFRGGWQMAVVASAVSGLARLLSAPPSDMAWRRGRVGRRVGGRVRGQLVGARACFGTTAEELLAEEAELGFAFSDAEVESLFALTGALMHGFPVTDLLSKGGEFSGARARVPRSGRGVGSRQVGKKKGGWRVVRGRNEDG
jgi:hypothetical protein